MAPAFVVLAGICVSLFLDAEGAPWWASVSGAALVAMFLVLAGSFGSSLPGFREALTLIFLFTILSSFFLLCRIDESAFIERQVSSKGTILYERPWGRGRVALVRTDNGRFVAHLPPSSVLREGDRVRISGLAGSFGPSPDDGGFDEGRYWKARGASGKMRRPEVSLVEGEPGGILWLRRELREKILRDLPPLMRGHLLAAMLGARDPELAEKHSVWGTSHLLAVSGLHVGMVVLLVLCCLPRGALRLPLASLVMWLYVLSAGAAPSALRAGLMLQAGFVGKWIGRPVSAVNAVSLAGLSLLFWRPWFFWDLGWRLSVLAALLLSSLYDREFRRGWSLAPVVLWIATAGMVSEVFGSVPVAGIVINFVAVPVFGILLPLAFILAIPSLAGIPGGWTAAAAGEALFVLWTRFADAMVSILPWKAVPSFFLNISGIAVAAFILLVGTGFRRAPAAAFSVIIAFFLAGF